MTCKNVGFYFIIHINDIMNGCLTWDVGKEGLADSHGFVVNLTQYMYSNHSTSYIRVAESYGHKYYIVCSSCIK